MTSIETGRAETMPMAEPFAFGPTYANTGVGQSYTAGITGTLATIGVYCNGPCNLKFRDEVIAKLTEGIDVAASVGKIMVSAHTTYISVSGKPY